MKNQDPHKNAKTLIAWSRNWFKTWSRVEKRHRDKWVDYIECTTISQKLFLFSETLVQLERLKRPEKTMGMQQGAASSH